MNVVIQNSINYNLIYALWDSFEYKDVCACGMLLSGVPDLWDRNKILRCGDLSHLHVPDCIGVFYNFVWFVCIHHNFQF